MINRIIEHEIIKSLAPGKVIGLFGARRTGKTFLMKKIMETFEDKASVLYLLGENLDTTEILASMRLSRISLLLKGKQYLFIDEAQKIPRIGEVLKLIVDSHPDLYVFVTGSSSFDLKNSIGEPLTGRSQFYYLYPIAQQELAQDWLTAKNTLEEKLIYGMYPQIINAKNLDEKKEVLDSIKNGYLLKDILELDRIKDSVFIFNLLRLIAYQIGKDVSYSELASMLKVNVRTVQRYLEILEKSFVLFSLRGFSRNLRKEYVKSPRYYFWDNGIRNILISNLNALNNRDDIGQLWENFCISERMKINTYKRRSCNSYFWRTYDQQEIDYLEETGGRLFAFEFKYTERKVKIPGAFATNYSGSSFEVIHQENFLDFVMG